VSPAVAPLSVPVPALPCAGVQVAQTLPGDRNTRCFRGCRAVLGCGESRRFHTAAEGQGSAGSAVGGAGWERREGTSAASRACASVRCQRRLHTAVPCAFRALHGSTGGAPAAARARVMPCLRSVQGQPRIDVVAPCSTLPRAWLAGWCTQSCSLPPCSESSAPIHTSRPARPVFGAFDAAVPCCSAVGACGGWRVGAGIGVCWGDLCLRAGLSARTVHMSPWHPIKACRTGRRCRSASALQAAARLRRPCSLTVWPSASTAFAATQPMPRSCILAPTPLWTCARRGLPALGSACSVAVAAFLPPSSLPVQVFQAAGAPPVARALPLQRNSRTLTHPPPREHAVRVARADPCQPCTATRWLVRQLGRVVGNTRSRCCLRAACAATGFRITTSFAIVYPDTRHPRVLSSACPHRS